MDIRCETMREPKNAGSKFLEIGLEDHFLN